MATLTVGGLYSNISFAKNHFKTLEEAIENSRRGDTIILKKNIEFTESPINHDLTIDGDNYILKTTQNYNGFVINSGLVTIKNLQIEQDIKSNFVLFNGSNNSLILRSITAKYKKKTDPRDWLPLVNSYNSFDGNLLVEHSNIAYLNTSLANFEVLDSKIGSFFNGTSYISIQDGLIKESVLENLEFYDNQEYPETGNLSISSLKTKGLLKINNLNTQIEHILVDLIDYPRNKYRKAFPDDIFEVYQVPMIGLYNLNGSISNFYALNDTNTAYNWTCLEIDNSNVYVKDLLADSKRLSTANNSKIKVDNTNPNHFTGHNLKVEKKDEESKGFSQANQELENLIGLDSVKLQIKQFLANNLLNKKRAEKGLNTSTSSIRHMIFDGNAGTGKTTVAKLLGEILYQEGILKNKNFTVATRKDLVGQYVGETAQKTHKIIENALDGILFIDEAYSLTPTGGNDFAQEAIDQLVMDAIEYKDRLIIIMAGYTKDMDRLLESNQGLPSRFPNRIEFPDYNLKELTQILTFHLAKNKIEYTPQVKHHLDKILQTLYTQENRLDGNARYIEILVNDLINIRDLRLIDEMNTNPSINLQEITDQDLEQLKVKRGI